MTSPKNPRFQVRDSIEELKKTPDNALLKLGFVDGKKKNPTVLGGTGR